MSQDIRTDFNTPDPVQPPTQADKLRTRRIVIDLPPGPGVIPTTTVTPQIVEIAEDGTVLGEKQAEWVPAEVTISPAVYATTVADLGLDDTATVMDVVAEALMGPIEDLYPTYYQAQVDDATAKLANLAEQIAQATQLRDDEQELVDEWVAKQTALNDPDTEDPVESAEYIQERIDHFSAQVAVHQTALADLVNRETDLAIIKAQAEDRLANNPFARR